MHPQHPCLFFKFVFGRFPLQNATCSAGLCFSGRPRTSNSGLWRGLLWNSWLLQTSGLAFIKGSWEAIFRGTDDFYLMKGGVRLYIWWLLPDEGWCETLHLMIFAWWRVVWDFTSDQFYLMKSCVRLYIWWILPDEEWCETLHLMTFTWWRVVWDFTSDDFCLMKGGVRLYIRSILPDEELCETLHLMNFTWWRMVWNFTPDDLYLMNGGVRLYIWWLLHDEWWCETLHLMTFTWWMVVWDFGYVPQICDWNLQRSAFLEVCHRLPF